MIRKMIKNFNEDICECNGYTDEKKEELEYTLRVVVFEILKILAIISLFSLLGLFKQIIVVLIVMSFTKPFMGGYHEDTQIKCLIATIILASIIITLSINNNLNLVSIILLNLITLFSVYHQAPIINEDMILTRQDLITRNKIVAMISCFMFFIISLTVHKNEIYSSIITWTLFIDSCLMFNKNKKGR